MFTAYGIAGLFGPWLAPKIMTVVQAVPYEFVDKAGVVTQKTYEAGNYLNAFVISGVMCAVSAIIVLTLKPPRRACSSEKCPELQTQAS